MSEVQNRVQIVDHAGTDDGEVPVARLCDTSSPRDSTCADDPMPAFTKRGRHIEMLCVATVVVILASIFQIPDGHRVALPGLSRFPFPETCFSKAWFGVSCPGCGLTRSFVCLAHGRLTDAIAYHRIGPILFLFTILQFPYRLVGLYTRQDYPLGYRTAQGTAWLLIFLLIGNWLVSFFL